MDGRASKDPAKATRAARARNRRPPAADGADEADMPGVQLGAATAASGRDPAKPLTTGSILGLQKLAGNEAVTQFVGGAAESTAVQRAPQEFEPAIPDVPDPVTLKVFQEQTQRWRITNWRSAPNGSMFHWGYAVSGSGQLARAAESDHGATTAVTGQAGQPGTMEIQGTPQYQVPGGPLMTGDVRRIEYPVEEPQAELLSLSALHDGVRILPDRLSANDTLIVRVSVSHIDGLHAAHLDGYAVTGSGAGQIQPGNGPTLVQTGADFRSYDIELSPTVPGHLDLSLNLMMGDIDKLPVTGITADVEFGKQEFINYCSECITLIERAYTRANSVMEVLSAAYGNAYDSYDKVLRAQDASNNLVGDILLGAILAFLPGGTGKLVGNLMEKAEAGDFLGDAVKDLVKAGIRGAENAAVGPSARGSAMKPLGDDPRTWRAKYVVQENTEKEHVLDTLKDWQTKAMAGDPDFFMNFNPVEEMTKALMVGDTPLAGVPVQDQKETERLFELGMWKTWLETSAYSVHEYMTCTGVHKEVVENTGKKVRDRINDLGEDGDAFVEQHGGVSKRKAEREAQS